MANETTENLGLTKVEVGTFNWDTPINQNWDIIDAWAGAVNALHNPVEALPENPSNVFYYIYE